MSDQLKDVRVLNGEIREVDFGKIYLKLKEYLDSHGITRNQLSIKTGIKYQVINKYYKNKTLERIDLVIVAKICYSLQCSLNDLLEWK